MEKECREQQSLMPDMHSSFKDAERMYSFLTERVCNDITDITFMCEKRDYHRLIRKPVYEGDFLKQMFDWNNNKRAADEEEHLLRAGMNSVSKKISDAPAWKDFRQSLEKVKYSAKHATRKYKRRLVEEEIKLFKSVERQSKDGEIDAEDPEMEYKINCEDFWTKRDDPRREQLFRKMHPLIFLKEEVLDNYVKVQNNWIFQFLTDKEKKQYLQSRKPKYLEANPANYTKHLDYVIKDA